MLNAHGVRVGEVREIIDGQAVIAVGGVRDAFGFVDLGGREIRVPLSELAAGKPRRIGSTTMVLPTSSTSAGEIERQLASIAE